MAVFPLCIDLTNKKCVIIGGGKIALAKIKVLIEFNPQITVISPECCDDIVSLYKKNKLSWIKKEYSVNDINEAYLVVSATSDKNINEKVFVDAQKNNILVNVVDDPEKCTFIFPSIVKRKDLIISISTSGKYPALSKYLRKKLEKEFSAEYGTILSELHEYRQKILKEVEDERDRKRILTNKLKSFLK